MHLRVAKVCDAAALAGIYYESNRTNSDSFLCKLGQGFITAYYRVVLSAPNSVAVCAVSEAGEVLGFASGTCDAAELLTFLNRFRWRLFAAAIPRLLLQPALFGKMLRRGRARGNEYIVGSGARWEYWAWHPKYAGSNGAMRLHRAWLAIMRSLGVKVIQLEINESDSRLAFLHRSQGAVQVNAYTTPDGLRRLTLQFAFH